MHILERAIDHGPPLPEADPALLIYGDEPRPIAVAPAL